MSALLSVFITAMGMLFAWFGISLFRTDSEAKKRPKITVEGEVIGHVERSRPGETEAMYAAVYRFTTPEGRTVDVTDTVSRNFAYDEIGNRYTLEYPQGSPEKAEPPRPKTNFAIALGLLLFGMFWMVAGIYSFGMDLV